MVQNHKKHAVFIFNKKYNTVDTYVSLNEMPTYCCHIVMY